jgi:CelD/BcsL family acetyltransferase involved in cellulose biosynthesis
MLSKGDASTMASDRLFAFFCDLARAALLDATALFYELRVDGHCAGSVFSFQVGAWAGYYNGSIDARYEALSPGTLLFERMFQDAAARGARTFDLMAGSDGYKRHWSRENARPLRYAVVPGRSLRNLPFSLWERIKMRRGPR